MCVCVSVGRRVVPLQRLLPCTWLNDEVVNMYMKLLDHRDKEARADLIRLRREKDHFVLSFRFGGFSHHSLLVGQGRITPIVRLTS